MSDPALKRRWFQFSLRTLFVVLTLFCIWFGWQLHVVREREQILSVLETRGVFVTSSAEMKRDILKYYARHPTHPRKSLTIPFYRRLLGDEAIVQIATFGNYDEEELEELFPEAEVMFNASRGFPGQ